MDFTQTKAGFPAQRRVVGSLQDKIRFPLHGSAPSGFWNHKLEFGVEVIRIHPPTVGVCLPGIPQSPIPFFSASRLRAVEETSSDFRRRAFALSNFPAVSLPSPLFWGEDVSVSVLCDVPAFPYYLRHADSHTLSFIHEGQGTVETDFGLLPFRQGDFILLPRGTTYAFLSREKVVALFYEFPQRILRPLHYWIDGYPFVGTAVIPAEPSELVCMKEFPASSRTYDVYVKKHSGTGAIVRYPFPPCDVVAWEGELYPFVLHLDDIRTLSSPNFHLDPKALTVFVTEDEGASIQVFLPRWIHSRPYPHQNYCTEMLFNHRGYQARSIVGDGCMSLHPPGVFHGPDLYAASPHSAPGSGTPSPFPWKDEVAVMLESRSPIFVLPLAKSGEIREYDLVWHQQYYEINRNAPS